MGSGGVAIAALPTVICLKVPFSDGLGGGKSAFILNDYNKGKSSDIKFFLDVITTSSYIIMIISSSY